MEKSHKPQFMQLLAESLAAYGKPLPETAIVNAWWMNLEAYPLRIVALAFQSYINENGEFSPVPAGIAMRCKTMDGRPNAEEAWAIALKSQDEADTVVWTAEIAEAFGICQTVLSMGDEVGARMAFKEAYTRIVLQARSDRRPAQWLASLGWDVDRRTAVLSKAVTAGLLAAPAVVALLPNYSGGGEAIAEYPEGLRKVKAMMADLAAHQDLNYQRQEAEKAAERQAVRERKDEISAQAASYIGAANE